MKFTTMKTILSLIVIGMVLSNNTMRRSKTQDGSGNWNNGYNCPKVFIKEGKGNLVDQGAAKIMGPQIENPTTDANKLGLNFHFEKAPAANSFITQIGTKVSDKNYYIPYRFFQGDMDYENSNWTNKRLFGTLVADNKKTYFLDIYLPYKTVGWYINDEESNKIKNKVNSRGVEARGKVTAVKNIISPLAEKYLINNEILKAISKDKSAFDKKIAYQQKISEKLKADAEALKAKIETAKQALFAKQKEVQASHNALVASQLAVRAVSQQINTINLEVTGLSNPNEDQLAKSKNTMEVVKKKLDDHYANLKKEISSKVNDFNKSKEGLEALDKSKFESGLNTSYPL
jgi:ribosomal protein L9